MRENCMSGSEGEEIGKPIFSTPIGLLLSIAIKVAKNALFPAARAANAIVIPLQLLYACGLFVNVFLFAKQSMACGAFPAGEGNYIMGVTDRSKENISLNYR